MSARGAVSPTRPNAPRIDREHLEMSLVHAGYTQKTPNKQMVEGEIMGELGGGDTNTCERTQK